MSERHIEVSHEALIRAWPNLRQWIDQDRAGQRLHRQITDAAREWKTTRDRGYLYRGLRLAQAFELGQRNREILNQLERRFLLASMSLEKREKRLEQERQRAELEGKELQIAAAEALVALEKRRAETERKARVRQRNFAAVLLVLFVISSISLWYVIQAKKNADISSEAANSAKRQAEASSIEASENELLARKAQQEMSEIASQADLSLAIIALERDEASKALAHLARAIRSDEKNHTAAAMACFVALHRNWPFVERKLLTLASGVRSARFSPDGKRIVTASNDKTAQVWSVADARPVGKPMKHNSYVVFAQFSPDGRRVVTASMDNTARIWDANTGASIGEFMKHHDWVTSARFSPSGRNVITASNDRTARIWDAETGAPVGMPMEHTERVESAEFIPGNGLVMTATRFEIQVWNLNGEKVGLKIDPEGVLWSAQISPDGERIATGNMNGNVQLWDRQSGKPIGELIAHYTNQVASAFTGTAAGGWFCTQEFSPDGQRLVTIGGKGARIWNSATGGSLAEPMMHEGVVTDAQFSPDGTQIVTACDDGTVYLWRILGRSLIEPMLPEVPLTAPNAARISADGRRLLAACGNRLVRLWDTHVNKALGKAMPHDSDELPQFSPVGLHFVTVPSKGTVRFWDANTATPIGDTLRHELEDPPVFSPEGKRIATGCRDGTVTIFDAKTAKPTGRSIHHEQLLQLQFSPDGRYILSLGRREAKLWDVEECKQIGESIENWFDSLSFMQCSPSGSCFLLESSDGTIHSYDFSSGKPLSMPMVHGGRSLSRQFSPDGNMFLTGNSDGIARLWDPISGRLLGESEQENSHIEYVEFSPNGQRFITFADKIQIWNAQTIKLVEERIESLLPRSSKFSPRGNRLLTTTLYETKLWDATTGSLLVDGIPPSSNLEPSNLFSPDGTRFVTVDKYRNVSLWVADSGRPFGSVFSGGVLSVQFSPDAQRLFVTLIGGTVLVFDCPWGKSFSQIADLAELFGGFKLKVVENVDRLTPMSNSDFFDVSVRVSYAFGPPEPAKIDPLMRCFKWCLDRRDVRTISPFSELTLPEWIEHRIRDKDVEGLRNALFVRPDNQRVVAHLGGALAARAAEGNINADEIRRVRAEADLLTRRAVELAPENDEVQDLRRSVLEQLQKTGP